MFSLFLDVYEFMFWFYAAHNVHLSLCSPSRPSLTLLFFPSFAFLPYSALPYINLASYPQLGTRTHARTPPLRIRLPFPPPRTMAAAPHNIGLLLQENNLQTGRMASEETRSLPYFSGKHKRRSKAVRDVCVSLIPRRGTVLGKPRGARQRGFWSPCSQPLPHTPPRLASPG